MATPDERRAASQALFNQRLSELNATNPRGLGAGRYQDRIVRGNTPKGYLSSLFGIGRDHIPMSDAEIDIAMEPSISATEKASNFIHGPEGTVAVSNITQPKNTAIRGWTEAQILNDIQAERSVGTPTSKMADAVIGTNPQGLGPPSMYNDGYGASFTPAQGTGLEPGVVPDSMVTPSRIGLEWAGPPRSGLEWAGPPPTTSTTTGFTPDTVAEGPHEDEPTYAYDPVPGRNLGILDASKGSFYDAYMAPQTVPSRMMSAFGPQIAMGTAIPNIFTAAKGVGKLLGRDEKTRGGSFLPSFSNIGRVSQGDRFANLMAAQHYADQGPEGWVQSDFVGNYNPLEGPMGYGNRMGSIDQEEAHTQEGIDRAGGYDIGAVIGDYLGGMFSGEENNNDGNDEGGWLGRLF